MTPTQAQTMWCPYAIGTVGTVNPFTGERGPSAPGFNRVYPATLQHSPIDSAFCCMASRCMAWRWDDQAGIQGHCGAFGDVKFTGPAQQPAEEDIMHPVHTGKA